MKHLITKQAAKIKQASNNKTRENDSKSDSGSVK